MAIASKSSKGDGDGVVAKRQQFRPEDRAGSHNIHFSVNLWQALQARCWDLNCRVPGLRIGVSTLIRDIVAAWLSQTTNWDDPMFNRPPIVITPTGMPPDRYPGYLADIGFEDEV